MQTGLLCYHLDTLRDYFSRYGEISECTVMKDPVTRRSRYLCYVSVSCVCVCVCVCDCVCVSVVHDVFQPRAAKCGLESTISYIPVIAELALAEFSFH